MMPRLNSGQIKTAANVRIEGVVKMLQRRAAAVPDDKIRVGVGFSAAYALFLHEKKEMKWKGLPRGLGFDKKDEVVLVPIWQLKNKPRLTSSAKTIPEMKRQIARQLKKKAGLAKIHKGFYWDPQDRAQPNFLVGPFREMRGDFVKIIQRTMKKTGNVELALMTAGLRLQREAQQRVPVEFGFLKASAWTRRLS
jgi:hypothetical protein